MEITSSTIQSPLPNDSTDTFEAPTKTTKQSVDYSTLSASIHEMQNWIPSRVEQVKPGLQRVRKMVVLGRAMASPMCCNSSTE